jgi:lipopolysaccharide transport system ATP-binding protein
VEKFLDTPVKHFSSGMYVRLAFAVAAHLEPEILIVDEVLAVGDAEFQKKCLGRMGEVSRQEGRTVLFVSHNLAAIAELTDRALLLNSGSVLVDGSVADALTTYLSAGEKRSNYTRPFDTKVTSPHVGRVEMLTSDPNGVHRYGEPLSVKILIRHPLPMTDGAVCVQVVNQFQTTVIHSSFYQAGTFRTVGCSLIECCFPKLLLNVGQFSLRIVILETAGYIYENLDGICSFEVVRIDKTQFWAWRPESCVYHEEHVWKAVDYQQASDLMLT